MLTSSAAWTTLASWQARIQPDGPQAEWSRSQRCQTSALEQVALGVSSTCGLVRRHLRAYGTEAAVGPRSSINEGS